MKGNEWVIANHDRFTRVTEITYSGNREIKVKELGISGEEIIRTLNPGDTISVASVTKFTVIDGS